MVELEIVQDVVEPLLTWYGPIISDFSGNNFLKGVKNMLICNVLIHSLFKFNIRQIINNIVEALNIHRDLC